MYDFLVAKYLFRFNSTSETEIKMYINLMFQNAKCEEKKSKKNDDSNNK